MFFEKNTSALLASDASHVGLVERLNQTRPLVNETDIVLTHTDDGQYNLVYKDVWLHDVNSPEREAKQAFKASCKAREDRVHLILGIGLGYLLDEAFTASPGMIIVYEPNAALLRFVLDNVDLSEMLASGRVQVVGTHFDLISVLRPRIYSDYDLDILSIPGTAIFLAEDTPVLIQKIKTMITDWARDYRTVQRFHPLWMSQFFSNLPHFARIQSIESLHQRFAGKPALVISRGPSLDAALDSVAELADSAVLVAVGSAVRSLWQRGVTPDFAVFYDANGIAEQLHGIPESFLENITFILCPSTQACAYESPSRGKLVFFSQNGRQMADWMDKALHQKHLLLEGGGTVSLIALELALTMGCGPIVLVGQDLAFPNNQVYAGGVSLQTNAEGHMALAASDTLYAEPEAMATVPGQNGETLPTLSAYTGFIRHFEALAVKVASGPHPVALYNASIGGAQIDGYKIAPLSDFRGRFTPWKTLQNGIPLALETAPEPNADATATRARQLGQALERLQGELRETIAFCDMLRTSLPESPDDPDTVPASELRGLEDTLWESTQRFFYFLHEKPFVGFLAMFEIIPYKQRFKAFAEADSFNPSIRDDFAATLANAARVLKDDYLVWVDRAAARLAEPLPL